jgi:hypothetical protein
VVKSAQPWPSADRPYKDLVLSSQPHDGADVVRGLLHDASKGLPQPQPRFKYVKHMAKHAVELGAEKGGAGTSINGSGSNGAGSNGAGDQETTAATTTTTTRAYDALLRGSKNFILVRDPAAIARSFSEVCPPTLEETCLPALCQLFSDLRRMHPSGAAPSVVLSEDLQRDPEVGGCTAVECS